MNLEPIADIAGRLQDLTSQDRETTRMMLLRTVSRIIQALANPDMVVEDYDFTLEDGIAFQLTFRLGSKANGVRGS